jgi:membrane protease subunit (stomatin/prohibitin family)
MGLLDKLRGELIDIVEWVDDSQHTLVWRFPRYQNEIKQGAKLIVRPGQVAIFVHQGKLADVFEPGTHELATGNLPILSTLAGWKYGFNSPFKSEVYFVSTKQITDLKWGTNNPIMLRDADFGPLRIRAFGTYALKAVEPRALLREVVGTDNAFEAEEINELMRSNIATAFADLLGESKIAALDLAANYQELSDKLRAKVKERVDDEYGLDVPQLFIVNISLPEEVEKALDTRTSMGVIGDMSKFQQFQMGKALTAAAENPSGGAATQGMGLGMGLAMAQQMMQGMGQASAAGGQSPMAAGQAPVLLGQAPPPAPGSTWHLAVDGQTHGPFTVQQIAAGIAQGQITAATPIWTAGMAAWSAAAQVPQFAGQFAAATPPPPPPK